MQKVYASPQEAIADMTDGCSVMVPSLVGELGIPEDIIKALLDKGTKDLTLICGGNLTFYRGALIHKDWRPYLSPRDLVRAGMVKKIYFTWGKGADITFPGETSSPWEGVEDTIEYEIVPMGVLAHRIRAGGQGIGAFFSPVGAGTWYAEGKESRVIDGQEYVLEYPLKADFGFVKAAKADKFGNLVYKQGGRIYNPLIAKACKTVIAQVDEIVEAGDIDPDHVMTAGVYVDRIVLNSRKKGGK